MAPLTRFVDLPSETLVRIISSLSCKDLARISHVSRRLHAITQRVLYKSPVFTPTAENISSTIPSPELFLKTILTPGCEALANHVRYVYVQWDNTPRTIPTDITFLTHVATRFNFQYPLISQDAQLMLLLHLLPRLSILEFDAYIVDEGRFPYHALNAASGSSPVTKLRFTNVDLHSRSIEHTLKAPRALTHLSYTAVITSHYFTLRHFISALQPLQNTVQYLHLDLSRVVDLDVSDGESDAASTKASSFRDWPALRSLSCSVTTMLGGDEGVVGLARVIPPGLREWEILEDNDWDCIVVPLVAELMVVKREVVPGLEKVVFGWGRSAFGRRVRVAAEAAGVMVVRELSEW